MIEDSLLAIFFTLNGERNRRYRKGSPIALRRWPRDIPFGQLQRALPVEPLLFLSPLSNNDPNCPDRHIERVCIPQRIDSDI